MDEFKAYSFSEARDARIGLLGGTFDPIHLGHLYAARRALAGARLDVVVIIPSGTPPHKPGGWQAAGKHRLRMAFLAAMGEKGIRVSDWEIGGDCPDYTVETLAGILGACGPGCSLHFIVGADALRDMPGWRQPERLAALAEVIGIYRPGFQRSQFTESARRLRKQYGARVRLLRVPGIDISSSVIRERVRTGQPIEGLVPGPVVVYIKENGLYLESGHA